MGEVDSAFIQPLEHRPNSEIIEVENIPLIDLSPLESSKANELAILVAEIHDACANWGFFQVINHGVPLTCRKRIEIASKKFFALTKEEKKKVSRDEVNPYGYHDMEHTKNVRDWKEVFDFTVQNPTIIPASHVPEDKELKELFNLWPEKLPLREAGEEYAAEMEKLAFKLLELISLSLDLPKYRLNGYCKDQTSRIRLNHYPPCPVPHLILGVGLHKDAGVLTILAQDDVGGLEVKSKKDGQWIFVKPIPNAYIVNIGDVTQVWSNEKYESVEHRAMVNSEKERFSIPCFFHPSHYTWVEPIQELINETNPSVYKGYNWGKYLAARNRGNFKKLEVENIQTSHFRI